jgi:hypothetical protein
MTQVPPDKQKKNLPNEYGPIKKGSQMPGRRSQSKQTRQQNSRPVSESSPPLSHGGGRKRVNKKMPSPPNKQTIQKPKP